MDLEMIWSVETNGKGSLDFSNAFAQAHKTTWESFRKHWLIFLVNTGGSLY